MSWKAVSEKRCEQQIGQTSALQNFGSMQRETVTSESISKTELKSVFVMVCTITILFNQEYTSETYFKKKPHKLEK